MCFLIRRKYALLYHFSYKKLHKYLHLPLNFFADIWIKPEVQEKFSWKSVVSAGLTAGIMQGLDAVLPKDLMPKFSKEGFGWNDVARSAIQNTVQQGVNVSLGLQEKFDWRGVVAAGVGAAVGYSAGKVLGNMLGSAAQQGLGKAAVQAGSQFAAGVTRQLITKKGKLDWVEVAVDAFGNMLGNALGKSLVQASNKYSEDEAKADTERELKRMKSRTSEPKPVSGQWSNYRAGQAPNLNPLQLTPIGVWDGTQELLPLTPNELFDPEQMIAPPEHNGLEPLRYSNGDLFLLAGAGPGGVDLPAQNRSKPYQKSRTTDHINDLITKSEKERALPKTDNLNDAEKAELFHRMHLKTLKGDAFEAYLNGDAQMFALGIDTNTRINNGAGKYDDRMVVVRIVDGSPRILYDTGEGKFNVDPSSRYEDGYAGRRAGIEGRDANGDDLRDLGRLRQGIYEFKWGTSNVGGAALPKFGNVNVLRITKEIENPKAPVDEVDVDRDTNHDDNFTRDDSFTDKSKLSAGRKY